MSILSEQQVCPHCGKAPWAYAPRSHQLPPGTILIGRYLLGAALGEGGFGITYLGLDLKRNIKVAVKEYFPLDKANRVAASSLQVNAHVGSGAGPFQEGKAKFLEEARILASIRDVPQIIHIRNSFEANNTAYIVTEFIDGITLTELVRRRGGRLPTKEVLSLMEGIFTALTQIHALGLIHRDISPDNIMLEHGRLRLLDFGIAREVGRRTETLTMTLRHGYAPVEQYQPMGQGSWTDVYALSATIYFCITGIKPPSSLERVCEDKLVLPTKAGADISHKQEQVLLYGMGVRPRRRFQTAEAMRKELYKR